MNSAAHSPTAAFSELQRNVATQDLAVVLMLSRLCYNGLRDAAGRWHVWLPVFALLTATVMTLVLARGSLIRGGPGRALVYRVGMLSCVGGSYFALRPLLPILEPRLLDRQLLALDQSLFGRTPAMWLEPFVTPFSVEWFAVYYYSFYLLLGGFVFGSLVFDEGRRRYELLLAVTLVMTIGHAGYTFVPGAGPYACPDLSFQQALHGGIWWARVESAVRTAGARYDIFPSLHTALSVSMALHAIRHRRDGVYSYVWGVISFWVLNIVVATMFLRWHYGVDVLAGLMLAWGAQACAVRLWQQEGPLRDAAGNQAVWEALLPACMPSEDRRLIMGVFGIQLLVCVMLLVSA